MKIYRNNIQKFVDSLSHEQVLFLSYELSQPEGLKKIERLLLAKLRGLTEEEKKAAVDRSQSNFSDLISDTWYRGKHED